MTQESGRSWNVSEGAKKIWLEGEEEMKERRVMEIEEWQKLGEELDATFVGVLCVRPGVPPPIPKVYMHSKDGSYFILYGKKGEIAGDDDPEEVRKGVNIVVSGATETLGNYRIRPIVDLEERLKKGLKFYTPSGYIDGKLYNPDSDTLFS